MATLTEIAKQAGVSVAAVSLVLNRGNVGTRVSAARVEHIRNVAKKLGYVRNYHATSIRKGRADTVAVAMDFGFGDVPVRQNGLAIPYFAEIIGGIDVTLRSKGLQMTIVGPDGEHAAPDRGYLGIQQRRFDGLIVLGIVVHPSRTDFLSKFHDRPVVVLDAATQTPDPGIATDQNHAMKLVVQHLAELGHRRALWVCRTDVRGNDYRHAALMEHAQPVGLKVETVGFNLSTHLGDRHTYDMTPDAVAEAMAQRLKRQPRDFTAVVCFNDNIAVGVCDALDDAGLRIPQDVSVVGYDNVESRRTRPRLTSIDPRFHAMGERGAQILMDLINKPTSLKRMRHHLEVHAPELVIRHSTGPAPSLP